MKGSVLLGLAVLVVVVSLLIPGEVRQAGLALLVLSFCTLGFWSCYQLARASYSKKDAIRAEMTPEASAEEVA